MQQRWLGNGSLESQSLDWEFLGKVELPLCGWASSLWFPLQACFLFVFYLRINRATNLSWKCYTFQLFSRVQCFLTPSAGPLPPFQGQETCPQNRVSWYKLAEWDRGRGVSSSPQSAFTKYKYTINRIDVTRENHGQRHCGRRDSKSEE